MKADKMIKDTLEELNRKRRYYLDIINKSDKGNYKNICSGAKDCKNKTVYKYEHLKNYLYFCTECINLKKTELPI